MMTERLLQYIWQFQYFNRRELQVSTGENLQIIHPGTWNVHQGPDFLQASIKINGTLWVGNVELHVLTSDWFKHLHQHDKNYSSVILHVVWKNDQNEETSAIPILQLWDKVPKMLLKQYEDLMLNQLFIPCEQHIGSVGDVIWTAWKERVLVERLHRKVVLIQTYLKQTNDHWEETFWWLLSRNFGIKVNADAFEAIARSLSINVLVRHKNQIHQLEALLLGQAGLLEKKFSEKYPRMLAREYHFLKNKYKLDPIHEPIHFLRMRPENFPTVRLAQLATLINQSSHLFSKLIETTAVMEVKKLLAVTANDYWHYHYRTDETSPFKPKKLGPQMVNNIITNTIVPILFAYGQLQGKTQFKEKALGWLAELNAEENSITRRFAVLGRTCKSAFDSQFILELKEAYCDKRRCLDCAVGNFLLKRSHTN
jgi:hypothetical protein